MFQETEGKYSGVCLIEGTFTKPYRTITSTGFLISKNIVVTCAHNLMSQAPDRIAVSLKIKFKSEGKFYDYSSNKYMIPQSYKKKQLSYCQRRMYTYAVIFLQGQVNQQIQPYPIRFFEQNQIKNQYQKYNFGFLTGFQIPKSLFNSMEPQFYQEYCLYQIISIKQNTEKKLIRHYGHTNIGSSGSPILNWDRGFMEVIGIHIGHQNQNFIKNGLLFDSQILQDIKQWSKGSFEEKKLQPKHFNKKMTMIPQVTPKLDFPESLIELSLKGAIKNHHPEEFLPKIFKLQELRVLDLSSNDISKFQINQIKAAQSNLKFLLLGNNQIKQIPTCVWSMDYLIELDLSSNRIEGEIVKGIDQLSKLILLNLEYNNISKFQINAAQSNLKFLLLGNNKIQQIPTCVWSMQYLIELDLSNNQLPSELKLYHGTWTDSQGNGFLLPRQIKIINISGNQNLQKLELSKSASWKYLKQLNAEYCSIGELQLVSCLFQPQGVIIKLKGNKLQNSIIKEIKQSTECKFFQIDQIDNFNSAVNLPDYNQQNQQAQIKRLIAILKATNPRVYQRLNTATFQIKRLFAILKATNPREYQRLNTATFNRKKKIVEK